MSAIIFFCNIKILRDRQIHPYILYFFNQCNHVFSQLIIFYTQCNFDHVYLLRYYIMLPLKIQLLFFFFIRANLYYYIAKPCFHSKIFSQELAYSCCNNRLGAPPPLCSSAAHFSIAAPHYVARAFTRRRMKTNTNGLRSI